MTGTTKLTGSASNELAGYDALLQSQATRDRLDSIEKLINARFEANERATSIATEAMEHRLHGMNNFREQLSETTNRMITRVEALSVLEAATRKTDSDVATLRDRLADSQKPNWPLMIGGLSMLGAVCGGVWLILGLKIDATITPNTMSVVALQEHEHQQDATLALVQHEANDSMQADLVSKADRTQLNSRLANVESTMAAGQADRRAKEESVKQKLVEIETQFCASDIVRNLMHATDMRIQSMLWTRTMPDSKIPTDNAYYPKVCNRATLEAQ